MNGPTSLIVLLSMLALALPAVGAPSISLRYPRDGGRTSALRIRVAGTTTPGAAVQVNGVQMQVAASGAFAGLIDLVPGENAVRAVAVLNGDSAEASVRVTCTRPAPPPPGVVRILEDSVEPSEVVEWREGDEVTVSFRGSPGGTASFSIDGLAPNLPMVESRGADGYSVYKGSYRISSGDRAKGASIKVSLASADETVSLTVKGTLSIMDARVPVVGMVTRDVAVVRASAYGAWDMLWPKGVCAEVTGRVGEMLRLSMPGRKEGWIHESSVQILPAGTPVPRAPIGTVIVRESDYGLRISVETPVWLPYEIKQTVSPPGLELSIYGGRAETDWLSKQLDGMIREIAWSQPEQDVYRLRITLSYDQQWGFDSHYEDGVLILEIKRPPKLAAAPASPFRGLVIAVDAGHGGRELGAVGAGGLNEKEVNLEIARMLARRLRAKGARVVMLRDRDVTVPLMSRPEKAAKAGADILVSIHNNSVPESSDPVRIRGTSTHWYHPQAIRLSGMLYKRAMETGLPGFGHVWSNLAITRPHRMIAVLIEGAFMSNPEEEALLATSEFRQKLADAVFLSLEDFLTAVRDEQTR